MPIFRGAGGAGDATNDATVTAVQAAATSAATSATNAANSATAAANSATGAATSATNASNSATTAAGQATTAAGHATNASTFATNSSLSADDSADSATEAEGYASEAFNYKVAASLSEGNASDYADAAQASQLAAETAALAVDGVLTDPDFITVLGLSDELQTVANNSANITAVANNAANINAVEANETNIDLVAANISDIGIVAENEVSVDTVAGIAANVTTVAGISANVTTVAGISANVTTVATNNANVTTVAGSIASVNTNATNIANINQNAANIVAIQNASANATAAAASATAAAGSATSASASAAAASAVALGNEPVRHSVRPSLLLDFANTKTLDPRITFTRASTGTYYDGKTVAKAEENLQTRSQEFETAAWIKYLISVTANSTAAPDGTTTAELIAETADNNIHLMEQYAPIVSGQVYTFSVFLKKGTGATAPDIMQVTYGGQGFGVSVYANFNLNTGAVTATGAGASSSSIASVGNGWYRCIFTATATATGNGGLGVSFTNNNGSATRAPSYAGATTADAFIWGAQLEQRSSVTAYTPTTTAPITNYIPALQTAAAGVARFEHNPITGESLGLEIEEQRTNLQTYSDDFSNVVWVKNQVTVTSNAVVAPDGALTGEKIISSTATSDHYVYSGASATGPYTFSAYAKAGENQFATLYTGSGWTWFNLSTGAVGTIASGQTATIQSVGNGWYRCSVTVSSGTNTFHAIGTATSNGASQSTGNSWNGIYIWGAQLEAGAFATSYIPTVASQVTRSADAASMTGTNFSSWYRADEGSIYVEAAANTASSVASAAFVLNNGSLSNSIWCWQNIQGSSFRSNYVQNAGSGVVLISHSAITLNSFNKASATYKSASYAGVLNGGTVGTSTYSQVISGINQASIGIAFNQQPLNGTIKKIAYYTKQLTNAELQGVTTV